jgi:ribosomal protein S18 acetylase RimI-like enzyme
MEGITIDDIHPNDRESLVPILEDSFEGIYLWHAKKTLKDAPVVRAATVQDEVAGLVMLKDLDKTLGYVYYIAVGKRFRNMGIGGNLLDNSLDYFFNNGKIEVYSSIETDNIPSIALFRSRGFRATPTQALSKKYGYVKSNILRMKMFLVPGEELWAKELTRKLEGQ